MSSPERSELHLIDEFGIDQIVEGRINSQLDQQFRAETGADDRRSIHCLLSGRCESVNAGCDGGLQCGGHINLSDLSMQHVIAGPAVQNVASSEVAHHLLGEKWVTRGTFSNVLG